jgi:DNA-binding winged helix-turn-helix (wHTH) protein/Tol biopolymer transport system component
MHRLMHLATRQPECYEFGPFQLDAEERELRREGALIPLSGKAFELLLILARRAGHTVAKTELLNTLWPDTAVEESNLTQTIFVVRRALGEGGDESDYIVTVPRRGYKFVAQIKALTEDPPVQAEPEGAIQPVVRDYRQRWMWFMAAVAALALTYAAGVSFLHFRETPSAQDLLNVSIAFPPDSTPGYLTISPDGRRLVVGMGSGGKIQLYVRSLDSPEYRPLPGTDRAREPFWSPDSRSIGFFAEGKLKTIPVAGGPATPLCGEIGIGGGGTWNREGIIVFASEAGKLRRVNAAGGPCTEVSLSRDTHAAMPEFLPDGKHFFYLGYNPIDSSSGGVHLASLDNSTSRKVMNDWSNVVYAQPASGTGLAHLLFLRETTLMAQPFDQAKLETVGDPFVVVAQASLSPSPPRVDASVSSNGTLVYLANGTRLSQMKWLDRSGTELGKLGTPGNQFAITLSPNGNKVAIGKPLTGIWLHDIARNLGSRFTREGRAPLTAVWSPDGNRIAYAFTAGNQTNLVLSDASGSAQETPLLLPGANPRFASDWSRDGRFLIYIELDPKTRADIWYLREPGNRESKPVKFLGTDAVESQAQLSPDGRWLAYYSDESGKGEVYIRPFPSGSGVWNVSGAGGAEPRWSFDGRNLFYLESQTSVSGNAIMAVSIQSDARRGLQIGVPQKLFGVQVWRIDPRASMFTYSPHPDGKRFLVNAVAEGAPMSINVITNWQKLAAGRVP